MWIRRTTTFRLRFAFCAFRYSKSKRAANIYFVACNKLSCVDLSMACDVVSMRYFMRYLHCARKFISISLCFSFVMQVSKSLSHSVSLSVCHSVSHLVSQFVSQFVKQVNIVLAVVVAAGPQFA